MAELIARELRESVPSEIPLRRRPHVPDHELLRCIGHGSYGEVWLARCVLGMLRAVKIVYRDRFQDARPYEREFNGILRIEPLSRAHEGLVDVLHVGRHEPQGYFYYVMELADDAGHKDAPANGKTIDVAQYQPRTLARELKRRGRLGFEECVQLGINLSSALSHLHQSGLIHRDVKPSNILYVGGIPKLGDSGLVGEAGGSASFVGTEGYVPPEGPGTAQADVYGLGKVLYEVSTGQDRMQFPMLPVALLEEPSQARLAEINAVVLKACASDPRYRYQTAEDLHADLALLHRGQSVRRKHQTERRWRLAALAGYLVAACLGLAAGVFWSPRQRAENGNTAPRLGIAPRQTPVDLSKFYNAWLTNNWLQDFPGNDLSSLPRGWHLFGATHFDVRGLIQLAGGYSEQRVTCPSELEGIPIGRRCERLHFMHGTVWSAPKDALVGSYLIHYADGRTEEIQLRYGRELQDWWWNRAHAVNAEYASLAWLGTNGMAGGADPESKVRLYSITWNNPYPEVAITRFDFISSRSASCPFLVAVTAE